MEKSKLVAVKAEVEGSGDHLSKSDPDSVFVGSNPAPGTISTPNPSEPRDSFARPRGRPRKCRSNSEHVDKDGKCMKCGDKIPCDDECVHMECLEALGKPLPDWVVMKESIDSDPTPA